MSRWPLGVFVSIDAGLGVSLEVARDVGVTTAHVHAPSRALRSSSAAADFRRRLDRAGIQPTVVFAGFDGESYADIPTVQRTVGLAPPETRAARTAELLEIARFARDLGVTSVGLHLGFIPHRPESHTFVELLQTTQRVCDQLADHGQALHLETGQETAEALLEFLAHADRANLCVNFDPANMILYGAGQPLAALESLERHVRSVHCKDALWARNPGAEWGVETPLGAGDVDFAAFLATLARIGYVGPLTIEREIPQEPARQKAEVAAAVDALNRLKSQLGD